MIPEGKPDKSIVTVPASLPDRASAVIVILSLSSPCFPGGKSLGETLISNTSLDEVTKNSEPAHIKSVVHTSIK